MNNRRSGYGSEAVRDFRTEVVSRPTEAMWRAMQQAPIGWASRGEDQSVRELERRGAELSGHAAALFVPTTSTANLLGLMSLGRRGEQVVLESETHMVWVEGWNLAYICGLVPRVIKGDRGRMPLGEVEQVISDWRVFSPTPTCLVCLENPHNLAGGTVLDAAYTDALSELAHLHGVAVHLDGARIHNAAVALGLPVSRLTRAADSVAISLNKGLGAPFGALFCASAETVRRARTHLHHLGAFGMHRAGILAAAALWALDEMPARLIDDHRRARDLAERLRSLPGIRIDPATVQTNCVRVDCEESGADAQTFVALLAEQGILVSPRERFSFKFTLYHELDDPAVDAAAMAMRRVTERVARGERAEPPGA